MARFHGCFTVCLIDWFLWIRVQVNGYGHVETVFNLTILCMDLSVMMRSHYRAVLYEGHDCPFVADREISLKFLAWL